MESEFVALETAGSEVEVVEKLHSKHSIRNETNLICINTL